MCHFEKKNFHFSFFYHKQHTQNPTPGKRSPSFAYFISSYSYMHVFIGCLKKEFSCRDWKCIADIQVCTGVSDFENDKLV